LTLSAVGITSKRTTVIIDAKKTTKEMVLGVAEVLVNTIQLRTAINNKIGTIQIPIPTPAHRTMINIYLTNLQHFYKKCLKQITFFFSPDSTN